MKEKNTKVAYCGDLHFGRSNNSKFHNEMLLKFIRFMVKHCEENDIGTIVFMGDYFDSRKAINLMTLHYGIQGMKYVHERFTGSVYSLVGNHDMYYRDRLDVSSTDVTEPYCNLIREEQIVDIGGHPVLMAPWVCDEEHWDRIVELSKKAEYCFGHFEFGAGYFRMNDHYVMEHGYTHRSFSHLKRVMSGHFHVRQMVQNIVYPGCPFPFDQNDKNTNERGFGVIDLDTNENYFMNFEEVRILNVSHEDLLSGKVDLSNPNTKIKVEVGKDVGDEVLEQVMETLGKHDLLETKIDYTPQKVKQVIEGEVDVEAVDNIDSLVLKIIEEGNEVEGVDKVLLKELYQDAISTKEIG